MTNSYRVAVLPGDGIGPEVVAEGIRVLKAVSSVYGFSVRFDEFPIGGSALDLCGDPFPVNTEQAVNSTDAVLLGAVGGPKWDDVHAEKRPEQGLLKLRKTMGTFVNLRPVSVSEAQFPSSPLKRENVRGTDMLIVRELTGGIYFGQPKGERGEGSEKKAFDTMIYRKDEIRRVAEVAFNRARSRKSHVTSVDKANVLSVSRLWRETVSESHQEAFQDVVLEHMYVDNAAMQVIRQPASFDVILTGNLFGDILSDLAATLPGSLGMLPSASIGGRAGLFEPVHGSAPDIAGTGKANPLATILSVEMMLQHWGETAAANCVNSAVRKLLKNGPLTPDLAVENEFTASTRDVGTALVNTVLESANCEAKIV